MMTGVVEVVDDPAASFCGESGVSRGPVGFPGLRAARSAIALKVCAAEIVRLVDLFVRFTHLVWVAVAAAAAGCVGGGTL